MQRGLTRWQYGNCINECRSGSEYTCTAQEGDAEVGQQAARYECKGEVLQVHVLCHGSWPHAGGCLKQGLWRGLMQLWC